MKKILILVAAAAMLGSCAKNKYVIDGNIEGLAGTVYMLDEQSNVVDSAAVNEGIFQFKGQIDTIDKVGMRLISDSRGDSPATFYSMIILEPGKIVIASDAENAGRKKVTGTPTNDVINTYEEATIVLSNEYRDEATTDERREAIDEEYNKLTRATYEANRGNYFGATLLAQQIGYELTGKEILDEIAQFSPELQQTQALTRLKATAEMKLPTDPGNNYIDITQNNPAGKPVSLKSVVENPANKYTLLDFWASWCGPCMGEVPVLKQTYDEFHGKGFEIYGVSFDRDREKWLQAIAENNMNWIMVSDMNSFNNQAAKDYGIQGIPSNFLIDAQGKIVATNLRGQKLYKKVSELLAE